MNTMIARFALILVASGLLACVEKKEGHCPAPNESLEWHFKSDSFASHCAVCDNSLSQEELELRAESLGWGGIDMDNLSACLYVSASSRSECERRVCQEGEHDGIPLTMSERFWARGRNATQDLSQEAPPQKPLSSQFRRVVAP